MRAAFQIVASRHCERSAAIQRVENCSSALLTDPKLKIEKTAGELLPQRQNMNFQYKFRFSTNSTY